MSRSFRLFQALLALAFLLLSSTFFSNPILELKDRVLLNNNNTIFAADVVKNHESIPEILYRLVIAYVPSSVSYMELDSQVVVNLIKQNLKGYEIRASSDKIIVQRHENKTGEIFKSLNELIQDFEKKIMKEFKDVKIVWPDSYSLPEEDKSTEYSYSYTRAGDRYINVLIKEISNGKVSRITNLRVELILTRMIVVAKRKINYGEIIGKDDIELKEVNIFGKKETFSDSLENVAGKRAKRSFAEGDPIALEFLEVPPYVTKGQIITAYVSINGITVTTFARLMEDGNIGEIVSARNVETGQLVYGVVEEGPKLRILTDRESKE
ncbi:MAG: flagellar basal body P-ring formation protein FlgA [Thermotogaceae bacterium]|nr:flagellar basal body P-ring formation protein FlgA [Thermotogaceae bacterium]